MSDRNILIERAVAALQDRVEELAAEVAQLRGDDLPTLREMLKCWPAGMAALGEEVGFGKSTVSKFALGQGNHFPVVLAARVVALFEEHGLDVFGEALTMDRLRRAWARAKREAKG